VPELCERFVGEFGCEVATSTIGGERLVVVTRKIGDSLRSAIIHDKGRGLSMDLLESILNRLEIPPQSFGIEPEYDA
jgi:hypothetical protein